MRAQHGAQDVEVMHFAQSVLQIAQVLRPLSMTLGQKILDRVAKALDADSQLVIGNAAAVPQRVAMQFARVHPALQRDMLKDQAFQRNLAGTFGQMGVQRSPLLAVEGGQRLLRRQSFSSASCRLSSAIRLSATGSPGSASFATHSIIT